MASNKVPVLETAAGTLNEARKRIMALRERDAGGRHDRATRSYRNLFVPASGALAIEGGALHGGGVLKKDAKKSGLGPFESILASRGDREVTQRHRGNLG